VTIARRKTEDGQEIGLSDEEKSILIKLSQEINNPQAQA